ncbi:3-isopropylmalate dehydratase small subunit [Leifsonia sp. LS1]|uniref:3-isopropylmalate dehydratase small subunit n=1 Tax=Leifsonia sp. LS1 TaxID=2828483 RepID=UPI001CFCB3AB|nr:3-isopropylmalate dehydratase small subunit [Leifsonia sp. LS1]GIT78954.1 3-isopropylmalate dehydratase small subunit [Leifsonia sp. LS1]
MHPVTTVTGTAVVLRRENIDTDQIIPAPWMKRIHRDGYGPGLFQNWRKDPDFPLNDPARAGASILVAGPNFGCGSSRQHAVWALRDGGFRAVISSRIADIHRTNLPQEGLVPVEVEPDVLDRIMDAVEADAAAPVRIDVVTRTVTCEPAGIRDAPFRLDDAPHHNLVNGLDPIAVTLTLDDIIRRHETRRHAWLPAGRPERSPRQGDHR